MKEIQYKDISVKGISIGGVESCYILPEFKIAFDMGRGPIELTDIPVIFLSHGHLDHAAGIAYYFSQRSLRNLDPGTVYAPADVVESLTKICKEWQKIEEFDYKINIHPIEEGDRVELKQNYFIKAYKSYHRVPANGYVLYHKVKKLKKEFIGLSGEEIKKRRDRKDDLFIMQETPIFAYSGDTSIEFLLNNESARNARVLFMECTYIDESRSIERARKWGHTHLDEILQNIDQLKNEKIYLIHLSRRYSARQAETILNKKIPDKWKGRMLSAF